MAPSILSWLGFLNKTQLLGLLKQMQRCIFKESHAIHFSQSHTRHTDSSACGWVCKVVDCLFTLVCRVSVHIASSCMAVDAKVRPAQQAHKRSSHSHQNKQETPLPQTPLHPHFYKPLWTKSLQHVCKQKRNCCQFKKEKALQLGKRCNDVQYLHVSLWEGTIKRTNSLNLREVLPFLTSVSASILRRKEMCGSSLSPLVTRYAQIPAILE